MRITKEELVKTRIELAKQMNKYIIDMGDEEIWNAWITEGIPDCSQEDDYEFFAEDNEEWMYLCTLFGKLVGAEGAD